MQAGLYKLLAHSTTECKMVSELAQNCLCNCFLSLFYHFLQDRSCSPFLPTNRTGLCSGANLPPRTPPGPPRFRESGATLGRKHAATVANGGRVLKRKRLGERSRRKVWYSDKYIWSLSPVPGTELLKPLEFPKK